MFDGNGDDQSKFSEVICCFMLTKHSIKTHKTITITQKATVYRKKLVSHGGDMTLTKKCHYYTRVMTFTRFYIFYIISTERFPPVYFTFKGHSGCIAYQSKIVGEDNK